MMPSIDVYQFVAWKGMLVPAQLQTGLVETSPGVDGFGAAIGAWRAPPVTIETVCYVPDVNNALSLRENFRALVGFSVSCTDQFGEIWNDVLVMKAQSYYSFSLFNDVRMVTSWSLLVDSVAAQ